MTVKAPREIKLEQVDAIMREDGIVQLNGKDRTYTVEDIHVINKAIGDLSEERRIFLLVVASQYSMVDNEARKYMSKPEAAPYSIAEAYVIKSLAQRLLINFFIRVSGTPVPTSFFTDIPSAVKWLKNFEKAMNKN